jgi:hypothetical protein
MSSDLVTYTPPSVAEWQQINEMTKAVAATEFVPAAMRGKPAAVLACVLTGRELGIGPMQSLKHIAIIEGKPGLSAELMAGLVRSRGHKLRIITRTTTEAEVEGVRADDPQHPLRVRWTLKDAERAGLCTISDDGRSRARDRNNKPMPWEKYPDAVLLARAISALCRALFSDVTAGFSYTAEEIESSNDSTEATWGEVEVDRTTGEVLEEGPIAGAVTTTPAPAMAATGIHTNEQGIPTGFMVPTLDDIKQIRTVRAAKEVIQSSSPQFQALVPRAISATYHTDPHQWWDNAKNVADWRLVLEYAVELGDYEQHEMSGVGVVPPTTTPDPTFDPGRADRTGREAADESATTPGSDDPQGGDGDGD